MTTFLVDLAANGLSPSTSTVEMAINSLPIYSAFYYAGAMRRASASEAYSVPVLMRAAIECAGYAAHIIESEEAASAWVGRHREFAEEARAAAEESRTARLEVFFEGDTAGRQACRREFSIQNWQRSLANFMAHFPNGGPAVELLRRLYAVTLDTGAHPNILMTLIGSQIHSSDVSDLPSIVHYPFTEDPVLIAADIENLFRVGSALARVLMAIRHPPQGNAALLERLTALEQEFFASTQSFL
ncbi:MAG TPA: hypothetical protein VF202_03120 [Trueperaceae bacterium]